MQLLKQPVYYANITLFNPKDSTVATGGISDEIRKFYGKWCASGVDIMQKYHI